MNEQLQQRLKALGADDRKIAALASFADADLERIVRDIEDVEVKAKAWQIAYKEAGVMSKNPDLDVLDMCGNVLDRVKDARGLGASTEVARAMLTTGLDLETGRAIVEKSAGSVRARYKTAASPALLAKLTAALAVRSEEEIGQLLDQIVAQGAMGGQLKDTDKARYKSAEEARLAKTARFFADGGRPLARPVSDGRGRPLE